jgi:phage shock protein E
MATSIQDKIKAGARVVDVRTPAEFVDGHYRSAVNIPVAELAGRLGELGAKTDALIVYCASGARSAAAARLLKTSGFIDVVNAGGLADMPR